MKSTLFGGVALFILGIVVALAQLWLNVWRADTFVKIEITIGAVFAILVAVWFTRKEYKDYRRQASNPTLDE